MERGSRAALRLLRAAVAPCQDIRPHIRLYEFDYKGFGERRMNQYMENSQNINDNEIRKTYFNVFPLRCYSKCVLPAFIVQEMLCNLHRVTTSAGFKCNIWSSLAIWTWSFDPTASRPKNCSLNSISRLKLIPGWGAGKMRQIVYLMLGLISENAAQAMLY